MLRENLLRLVKLLRLMGLAQAFRFAYQWLNGREYIEFKLRGIQSPIWCRRSSSDVHVLWQIFGMQQYAPALPSTAKIIIDAGANVGYSSLFFATTRPTATVLAIEPEPGNCEILRRNCHQFANIFLLEAALWPNNELLQISSQDVKSWSFQVTPLVNQDGNHSQSIRAITMEDILARFPDEKIDYLKLDIEGAERSLFETRPEDWLEKVINISVECHDSIFPGTTELVIDVMNRNHFQLGMRTGEFLLFKKNNRACSKTAP